MHLILPPRLLKAEEGGVHHATDGHVGKVLTEVLHRHPVISIIEMVSIKYTHIGDYINSQLL